MGFPIVSKEICGLAEFAKNLDRKICKHDKKKCPEQVAFLNQLLNKNFYMGLKFFMSFSAFSLHSKKNVVSDQKVIMNMTEFHLHTYIIFANFAKLRYLLPILVILTKIQHFFTILENFWENFYQIWKIYKFRPIFVNFTNCQIWTFLSNWKFSSSFEFF